MVADKRIGLADAKRTTARTDVAQEDDAARATAVEVVERARALGVRIAVAESLTGGLLTAALVSVPGASRVLSGGVVAYDTALKASLLGVNAALLHRVGPVDGEVAAQMAGGVRVACGIPRAAGVRASEFGIATTGVAGPDPDPATGQPPGTVWIGVSSSLGTRAVRVERIGGDRDAVRRRAVEVALELLNAELRAAEAGRDPAEREES